MHKEIKKEIGTKIRQLRTVKGWSREQTAEKLDMSVSNYGNIERGDADIGITRLAEVAEVFDISLQDLLGLNEKTVFNFTKNTTVNNAGGVNPILNNISDLTLKHELEKSDLLLKEHEKEIENLKVQISQLQEINALLRKNAAD